MNTTIVKMMATAAFFAFGHASLIAQPRTPDLKAVPEGKGWKGAIAEAKLIEKDGAPAIEFNTPGSRGGSLIWLDGFEFETGTIEFDAKGKSAPPQYSFVGVAFRVANAETHDTIYFRPFNFQASDPEKRAHAVQYVSEPAWPWNKLREGKTGQYEKAIEHAPDGDAWFHVKLVIGNRQVKVYVGGAAEPSLTVNELSDRTGGSVGLWCNGYGAIANLKFVTK